ncbi:MAG: DUF3237 domain-containing protein [Polyangiaceae bacterium]
MRRREFIVAISGAVIAACASPKTVNSAANNLTSGIEKMELQPLATMIITMGRSLLIANAPVGARLVIDFTDIVVQGERLKAKKASALPAGDWLTLGPNDVATLDIRFVLETEDGATIFVHGTGRTDSAKFSKGAPCYFTPVFETSDARYAWLNKVQAVARGVAKENVVTFELAVLS